MAKQSGKSQNDEIDFTNPEDLSKVIKNSTGKKKSKQNLYDKIIGYVTMNIKKVAIIAIYIVLSGIVGNIVFIINNPLFSLVALGIIGLIYLVIYFKDKKKNGTAK